MRFSDLDFQSPKEAIVWFSALLDASPVGHKFEDPDHSRLYELVEHHADSVSIIGPGIKYFLVQRSARNREKIFTACRLDGSFALFTPGGCLGGYGPRRDNSGRSQARKSPKQCSLEAAARTAVRPGLARDREAQFAGGVTLTCPKTGEKISWKNAMTILEPPLPDLLDDFMAASRLKPDDIQTTVAGNGEPRFVSSAIASLWIEFFNARCQPIYIHPSAREKRGSKRRSV